MKFEHTYTVYKDQYHLREEMQDWCVRNIGPGGYIYRDHFIWTIETAFGTSVFRFKNDRDRNWFAMMYS